MPSSTFFRLPEEKRRRLVDAAWEEFSQVRYADASINRIIQSARIPRGSFYQYFEDKDDLFGYLMEDVREHFKGMLAHILEEERGDLFRLPIRAFDLFMGRDGNPFPLLGQVVSVLKANRGMDIRLLLTDQPGILPPPLLERVDRSRLRKDGEDFVNRIFSLIVASLAMAIMETLCFPDQRERQREELLERIGIIRDGSLRAEAAPEHT